MIPAGASRAASSTCSSGGGGTNEISRAAAAAAGAAALPGQTQQQYLSWLCCVRSNVYQPLAPFLIAATGSQKGMMQLHVLPPLALRSMRCRVLW